MQQIHRIALRLLALALVAWVFVVAPASAHDGQVHDDASTSGATDATFLERAEAITMSARVRSAQRIAPDAVDGACTRTIEVPMQGPSCDLGDGTWGVHRADGTTARTHGPDIYAAGAPQLDLSVADAVRLAEAEDFTTFDDSEFVTCEQDPRVPRTVAVFAQPTGVTYTQGQTDAIVLRIRRELRKASAFVQSQAAVDRAAGAGEAISFRMDCVDDDTIDVRVVQIARPATPNGGYPPFSAIEAAIRATNVVPGDDAGRIVAYVPIDMGPVLGQGWVWDDSRAVRDNLNNGEDLFAAHYLDGSATSPNGITWDIFLHEMLHNMGAVTTDPDATDANQLGHCRSDQDVMCYEEGGRATYAKCAKVQLDCGRDTYFNAADAPGGWLATNWNAGATTNRYLDFGTRTPADIVAPTRPTGLVVTSPAANTVVASWNASSDPSGVVQYDLLHGTLSPTNYARTPKTGGRLNGVPGGTRKFWVLAYDTHFNVSMMSEPVTVQVEAPPAVKPPDASTTPAPAPEAPVAPTSKPVAPPAPIDVRVTSIRPGVAQLAWSAAAGTSADTTYRIELLDADTKAWQFATLASTATSGTARIRQGTSARARIVARNEAGSARSSEVRFVSSVRGASCRWSAGDSTAPTPATRAKVAVRTARTVKLTYRPPTDANGVCAVRLLVRQGSGPWRAVVANIAGSAKSATFTSLKPRTAVQLAIEAIDARGNVSKRTVVRTRTR